MSKKKNLTTEFGIIIHPKLSHNDYYFFLYNIIANIHTYSKMNSKHRVHIKFEQGVEIAHLFIYSRTLQRQFVYVDSKGKSHNKIGKEYVGELIMKGLIECGIITIYKGYQYDKGLCKTFAISTPVLSNITSKFKKELLGDDNKESRALLIDMFRSNLQNNYSTKEKNIVETMNKIKVKVDRVSYDNNVAEYIALHRASHKLYEVSTDEYTGRHYTFYSNMSKSERQHAMYVDSKRNYELIEVDLHAAGPLALSALFKDEEFSSLFKAGENFYQNLINVMLNTDYSVNKEWKHQSMIRILENLERQSKQYKKDKFISPLTIEGMKKWLFKYLNSNNRNVLLDTVFEENFPVFFAKLTAAKEAFKKGKKYTFDNGLVFEPEKDKYYIDKGKMFIAIIVMRFESLIFSDEIMDKYSGVSRIHDSFSVPLLVETNKVRGIKALKGVISELEKNLKKNGLKNYNIKVSKSKNKLILLEDTNLMLD